MVLIDSNFKLGSINTPDGSIDNSSKTKKYSPLIPINGNKELEIIMTKFNIIEVYYYDSKQVKISHNQVGKNSIKLSIPPNTSFIRFSIGNFDNSSLVNTNVENSEVILLIDNILYNF